MDQGRWTCRLCSSYLEGCRLKLNYTSHSHSYTLTPKCPITLELKSSWHRESHILINWRGICEEFLVHFSVLHCFICRPPDSTGSEDAGIEPGTIATSGLAVRDALTIRLHLIHTWLDLIHNWQVPIHNRLNLIHIRLNLIHIRIDLIQIRLDFIHNRLDLIQIRLNLIQCRLDLIHTRLNLIHIRLNLIHTRLDLIYTRLISSRVG